MITKHLHIMKKQLSLVLLSIPLHFFCHAQINPVPVITKPIQDKAFPKKEYVENLALLKSFNWWKRINPENTIYFQSINLVSIRNADTSFKSYSTKTIMTLTGFENLTNIISLSNDSLVHLEPLIYLEKLLVRYDINDAGISHLAQLRNLTHLEATYTSSSLTGNRNEYRDIHNNSMDIIGRLSGLEILRLHYSKSVTDAGLEKLKRLTNLKELDLTQWGITDNGLNSLSGMSKLEVLNLTATAITDAGVDILISILPRMTSIKKIILTRTQVSEKGIELLKERFPRLTVL